jgi:hypothetical protein
MVQKPVDYFAYPSGVWTDRSVMELKSYGYKAAFQLSGIQDENEPLYTIRRLMVQENFSAAALYQKIRTTFH